MKMKIQFEALSVFTFLVEVVFGFIEFNDALRRAPNFQDRSLPFEGVFEGVPRHTRCIIGPYGTSDKWFGDVNALPYLTRCTTEPYGPAGSTQGPSLAKNNPYAANAPHEAELSQSPDFTRRPTLTIFTEKLTRPYFKGKPGEGQTAQNTFNFREAEMSQPGPHVLFNQIHPFQRTKEYWLSIDESEYFPPVRRNQDFLNTNMASEPAIKSDHPSRRHKFARSISQNELPNHSLDPSLYMQRDKTRRNEELLSSGGNLSPLSLPSSSFPEYPSLPFFSEEDEEDEDEDEEEHPYYPQYTLPFFPKEQAFSSLHQYTSPPFFPEEQRFHQYSSPPFFPQEPRTFLAQYHYSQYARPETLSFFESNELPFAKSFPFNRGREPFAGDLGLVQTQRINGRPRWDDEANGVNGFWSSVIER